MKLKTRTELDVVICLGNHKIAGALPLIPDRFRLSGAFFAAVGWRDGDADGETGPTGEANAEDLVAVYAAAIGMCWPDPRPWPSLRARGRDVVDYGERVLHHLASSGFTQQQVIDEGKRLAEVIRYSVPTAAEVREVEADFSGPAEGCTVPTAGSV